MSRSTADAAILWRRARISEDKPLCWLLTDLEEYVVYECKSRLHSVYTTKSGTCLHFKQPSRNWYRSDAQRRRSAAHACRTRAPATVDAADSAASPRMGGLYRFAEPGAGSANRWLCLAPSRRLGRSRQAVARHEWIKEFHRRMGLTVTQRRKKDHSQSLRQPSHVMPECQSAQTMESARVLNSPGGGFQ